MAGRRATRADYPALDALWTPALVAMRVGWPTPVKGTPDFSRYPIYVSTDAHGIRFGIVTRPFTQPKGWRPKNAPPNFRLDEETYLYIGPRAGLTPSQFIAAHLEALKAWAPDIEARGVDLKTYTVFGVVPTASIKTIHTVNWAGQQFNFLPGEWPETEAAMTCFYDTVAHWKAAFP